MSKIEWTDITWNPVSGCTKISEGCKNCYAEVYASRLRGKSKYRNRFDVTLHDDVLKDPIRWKNLNMIFVCSMGDLFHVDVPFSFIDKVMETIKAAFWHPFQILTKRPERMAEYFADREIPRNVWLGVTVENQAVKGRIDCLRSLDASVLFLSCEPLLEDLGELDLTGIDWVIVGGESGSKARPMKEDWVLSIKEQAEKQGAAFFFKQWGTWGSDGVKRNKKANGKLLQGQIHQEMPTRKR